MDNKVRPTGFSSFNKKTIIIKNKAKDSYIDKEWRLWPHLFGEDKRNIWKSETKFSTTIGTCNGACRCVWPVEEAILVAIFSESNYNPRPLTASHTSKRFEIYKQNGVHFVFSNACNLLRRMRYSGSTMALVHVGLALAKNDYTHCSQVLKTQVVMAWQHHRFL